MHDDPIFWRKLIAALITVTEQGRVPWRDTRPDEPRLRSFFPDGMVHLILPEEGVWPPYVKLFGRYQEPFAEFHPELPEDRDLVERLYRLADRVKLDEEEDMGNWLVGRKLVQIEAIYRDIEKELASKNKTGKNAPPARVGS